MEFEREFIVIGNALQIRYYGIIIVTAMLAAAWAAARLAKRDGRDPDHVWGALTWAIIPGIVFARLWFVLFPPASLVQGCFDTDPNTLCQDTSWMLQNFFNTQNGAIAIWSGGLGFWGAVLGGLLGTYAYFDTLKERSRGISFVRTVKIVVISIIRFILLPVWLIVAVVNPLTGRTDVLYKLPESIGPWLDIAGVVLPLGQAIGRWANFVNQELYGSITTLPWGITIDSAHRVAPYKSTVDYPVTETRFHPLFLYESLWNIVLFFVLLQIFQRYRSRLRAGDIFLLYVVLYTPFRFLLEFLRAEPAWIPGTTINSSQTIAVIAFVVAAALFVYRHRPGLAETPSVPAEQQAPEKPTA